VRGCKGREEHILGYVDAADEDIAFARDGVSICAVYIVEVAVVPGKIGPGEVVGEVERS